MAKPLKGMAELEKYLRTLPEKIKRDALHEALRAAGKPVIAEARRLAPKQSGKLAQSIMPGPLKVTPEGYQYDIWAYDRIKGGHGFLAFFHEYGVKPHLIKASKVDMQIGNRQYGIRSVNNKIDEGSLKIGDNFVGPYVMHPGHAAQPFMRPALDNKQDEAVSEFARVLRKYIEDNAPMVKGKVR